MTCVASDDGNIAATKLHGRTAAVEDDIYLAAGDQIHPDKRRFSRSLQRFVQLDFPNFPTREVQATEKLAERVPDIGLGSPAVGRRFCLLNAVKMERRS